MKKIFTLLLCFLILAGCGGNASGHESVTINYPTDSTVNGYRVSSKTSDTMPDTVSKSDTLAESPSSKTASNTTIQYCANISSKVFHLPDCSSVSTIKEHNKLFLSDRAALIEDGYKPCGRCNP